MKFVALMSGGKDSVYAAMECAALGHELVCVANLAPPPPMASISATSIASNSNAEDSAAEEVLESDSFMYQTVGHDVVPALATCLGVPLIVGLVRGSPLHQGLAYMPTTGDEVEDLLVLLADVVRRYPEVEAVCCGAVLSTYQRLRVECVCNRLGLRSLAPLWQRPQGELVDEMIAAGVECVLCKVASIGLDPYRHLNAPLAKLRPLLATLHAKYGVHECGEGGEYESLCLDAPIFRHAKIVLDDWSPVLHGDSGDVGLLRVRKWHTEPKAVKAVAAAAEAPDGTASRKYPAEVLAVNEEATRAFLASRAAETLKLSPPPVSPAAPAAAALKLSTAPEVVVSMGPTYVANDFVFASGAIVSSANDAANGPSAATPLPAAAPLSNQRLDAWTFRWAVGRTSWHLGAVVHPCLAKFEDHLLPSLPSTSSLGCLSKPPRVLVPLAGKAHDVAYFAARGCDVVAVECASQALEQFVAAHPGATAVKNGGDGVAAPVVPEANLFQRTSVTLLSSSLLNSEVNDAELKDKEAIAEAKTGPQRAPRPVLWLEGDFLALKDAPSAAGANPPKSVDSASAEPAALSVDCSSDGGNNTACEDLFDAAFDRGGLVAVAPGDRAAYALTLVKLLKPGVGRLLLVCTEHPPFTGGALGPPFSVEKSEVTRLFGDAFTIELLQVEDRMEHEPSWRDRGCTWFREATYLLTRTNAAVNTDDNASKNNSSSSEPGPLAKGPNTEPAVVNAEEIYAADRGVTGGAPSNVVLDRTAATSAAAAAQCSVLLKELNQKLLAAGCTGGLNDAAFVHLYLRDMNHFAAVNEEYCRHFKTLQPASRSCVAALLPPGVHLLVDCVALSRSAASAAMVSQPTSHAAGAGSAISQRRDVLHVQSLSRWAPLCIGPYCQANRLLRGSLLMLAGQIGLVPETMQLAEATGATAPMAAAFESDAVSKSTEGGSGGTPASEKALLSPTVKAQLDQATWNTGQLLTALQSAWGKGLASSLSSSTSRNATSNRNGGSSRSGALCGILYVNTSVSKPVTAMSGPNILGALRERCLHNCRRDDNGNASSDGDASTPLKWPPKPSMNRDVRSRNPEGGGDNAAGSARSAIKDLSAFPLLVVGVPDLPKGAAVELEIAALSSAAVEALQPQHLEQQFTWRDECNNASPLPGGSSNPSPSSSSMPWLPIDLPRLRCHANNPPPLPPSPSPSSTHDAGAGQAANETAIRPLQVTLDITAVSRVLAFGFVHVHSSSGSSAAEVATSADVGGNTGIPGKDIGTQCSLHYAAGALVAGIQAALRGRGISSSMHDVSSGARLGWRSLCHLRVFYVPSVLASDTDPTDKSSKNFSSPAKVAAAVASRLTAAGAPKTAVTAVPVSALPSVVDAGHLQRFVDHSSAGECSSSGNGHNSYASSSVCALVGQITALDPLQFETAQWVAKLDADTSSSPSPMAPSTRLLEAQDEKAQDAEVPTVEVVASNGEDTVLSSTAMPPEAARESANTRAPVVPTPVAAAPVKSDALAMDDDAFDEIFGVDFKAMREGSEVDSESDED